MCEGFAAAPSALSTQLRLDNEAYQYGATRTWRFPCPRGDPFVGGQAADLRLTQNEFKAWQAGSVERGDVSLALQGEEILTIAAGDDAGLWRVALYRRKAEPPSKRRSEEERRCAATRGAERAGGAPGVRFVIKLDLEFGRRMIFHEVPKIGSA